EYGVIRLFDPSELRGAGVDALFDLSPVPAAQVKGRPLTAPVPAAPPPALPAATVVTAPAGEVVVAAPPADGSVVEPPLPLEVPHRGALEGLDPEQRAAAAAPFGPLLIVAGPGTGKTRTLTHRIAHLVTERDVHPATCLAITFTRRAAGELTERLAGLIGNAAAQVTVSTFHAFALRVVREQHASVGFGPRVRVADPADRAAALTELTGAPDTTLTDELREPYAKALRADDLVDLDDLVPLAVTALAAPAALTEEVAANYRRRYRHVFVDEYQDVDADQYALLRLIAPPEGDLCAIGDPDQSIYSFRGADLGFFLRFAEDYPSATTVRLTRNYRSAPPIVAAAVQAIRPGTLVPGRALTAERRDLGAARIGLHRAATEAEEAAGVARTVDALVGGSSFHSLDSGRVDGRDDEQPPLSFAEIAVLYRTDAQSKAVAEAFDRAGVPYQKRGHDRLTDRPGVAALVREVRHHGAGPLVDRLRRAAAAVTERAVMPSLFATEEPGAERHGAHAWSAADLLAPLARRCGDDT
ncbi:MAG TPA: ATP-dependent helicase, partial [Cryptosporangiaceae bacterium]|nr:ATP-dependent helicase [Cryptosporangiaceae bacterium]